MAFDTGVLDLVPLELSVETFPEFDILDVNQLFPVPPLPAVGFPFRHPLGNPFADVDTVGENLDRAGAFQCRQSLDDGFQFHLVICCHWQGPRLFNLLAAGEVTKDEAPATRSGISAAATIGEQVDFNRFAHISRQVWTAIQGWVCEGVLICIHGWWNRCQCRSDQVNALRFGNFLNRFGQLRVDGLGGTVFPGDSDREYAAPADF